MVFKMRKTKERKSTPQQTKGSNPQTLCSLLPAHPPHCSVWIKTFNFHQICPVKTGGKKLTSSGHFALETSNKKEG